MGKPQNDMLDNQHNYIIASKLSNKNNNLHFFNTVAKKILSDINPKTVLDAGCATGFLVEKLRDHNIDAFGIDIDEDAIKNVHPSIKNYCQQKSLTEAFPQQYDLIVCIEVLEHMPFKEAQQAIANFCAHTDDILFSSTPFDYQEPTHFNVHTPDKWVKEFAKYGFVRDVDFDASFITPWTIRFRRSQEPLSQIVSAYERRYWELWQENLALRDLSLQQRQEVAKYQESMQKMERDMESRQRFADYQVEQLQSYYKQYWRELEDSVGWKVMLRLQSLRAVLMPPGSIRDQFSEQLILGLQTKQKKHFSKALSLIKAPFAKQPQAIADKSQTLTVDEISLSRPPIKPHQLSTDIIICVHNALADVQRCLEAVTKNTTSPYNLILVDDGSNLPTANHLAEFAHNNKVTLLRNDVAKGYTLAANQGLQASSADYVILLNSDTVVTPGWLDRLIACADSNPQIGLVGPLSNGATWQSIPDIIKNHKWAENPLPPDINIEQMGALVAQYTSRHYPIMPFLNGFCLLIKREVISNIGYFDEANFGVGYGEENDYCLRARKAGWLLGLADDAYVYHAVSRSYSHQRREALSGIAGATLINKHGKAIVAEGEAYCLSNRVLEGIRASSHTMLARYNYIQKGRNHFAGKRILFLLPLKVSGGGGLMVVQIAGAMREMGVQAEIFNLKENEESFLKAYPALKVPVTFGEVEDLGAMATNYDAIIATAWTSVAWIPQALAQNPNLVPGYFIQDFEPYFYTPEADYFQQAWNSYFLIPDMVMFTTTEWLQQEVTNNTGKDCAIIGASFNTDLFRPRPQTGAQWPERPLRIGAMIRPESPYRAAKLTMEILETTAKRFGNQVDIQLFGAEPHTPLFLDLPRDFNWRLAGRLNTKQIAHFMNEIDIFVDFSSYQALGLTALEAMACGVAVIVPQKGGTSTFAQDGHNALVVDTASPQACRQALWRLIEEDDLRTSLQQNAIHAVIPFYPEKQAYNTLNILTQQN